jgi:hypothetical protein
MQNSLDLLQVSFSIIEDSALQLIIEIVLYPIDYYNLKDLRISIVEGIVLETVWPRFALLFAVTVGAEHGWRAWSSNRRKCKLIATGDITKSTEAAAMTGLCMAQPSEPTSSEWSPT